MKKVKTSELVAIAKRLWKDYISRHKGRIVMIAILLTVSSATTSAQPLLIQQAYNKVFRELDPFYMVVIPLAIVVVFSLQALALYSSSLLMAHLTNAMSADMRKDMFRHVIDNELEFYTKNDSGSISSRMMGEVLHIAAAISNFFNSWCRQFITSLGLLAVMLYQSVELTLMSLVVFVVAVWPLKRITSRLKKLTRQQSEKNVYLNTRLIESMNGVRTVKAFRKEEFEIEKISGYVDEIYHSTNKNNRIGVLAAPIMNIVGGCAVAFIIWYGGQQLLSGKLTVDELIAFIASLMMFGRPVRSLSSAGGVMVKGYTAASRFYELMDIKPKFVSRDHGEELHVSKAELVFENVSFAYPNGAQAVSDVNVTFEAGKRTALVGHSGSGKSTIFNLIMKFYEPSSGRILIDGQELGAASINSARNNLALVSQDIFIFDASVLDNIGYGREGASEEEIIEAARAAHCHEFITQLPQGYKTKLGFAGESLSGGQKQRIAIARAFLRNAPILLLDEATSALDPRTEADIQTSLMELSRNRTTIIIAHRLSTVMHADKMILMEQGKVVGQGTHAQLAAESAIYRHHFGL